MFPEASRKILIKSIIATIMAVLVISSSAFADRGMITAYPDISVYEPGQKAILAWNGEKEVMILSTDVRASGDTKVLEIIPFYSEPEIEKGDFKSFSALEGIFMKNAPMSKGSESSGLGIEIVAHKRIGPHDLTTIFVNFFETPAIDSQHAREERYAKEFKEFVTPYLEGIGISSITFPDEFGAILNHYSAGGYRYTGSLNGGFYCVLDVIDIGDKEESVTPLVYTFETDMLYYPLEISKLASGETNIQLYLVMEGIPDLFHVLEFYYGDDPIDQFELGRYSSFSIDKTPMIIQVDEDELKEIDARIADLFSQSQEQVYITAIKFTGDIKELHGDIGINRVLRPFTIQ
ncbi:MAG: hypothetical protein SVE93_01255 [Candidatus Thermoplasmatota archaeon]|nr:hypothetical protein [Candidatus Thermoplasmatota archaeon]